ncbi:hypothetical protein [Aerosakkonema funiforme]|uniref:hypothetical protein n=1 Tax=Aerosakkonema funiforme TaxID=1246630 RepID=UPI0035B8C1BD
MHYLQDLTKLHQTTVSQTGKSDKERDLLLDSCKSFRSIARIETSGAKRHRGEVG